MSRRQIIFSIVGALAVVVVCQQNWAGTPVNSTTIEQLLIFALPTAAIYALAATGLVVVYNTTGVFNFSQGAVGMLAAYVYWQLHVDWGWSTWLSVVMTVFVLAPLFGIALERLIMRHLAGKDLVVQLMVTVGLMLGFIGVANTIWDPNLGRSVDPFFGNDGIKLAGVVLTYHRLIAFAVGVALVVGLRFLLVTTRTGVAMRAVVDNRGLAALNGVSASRVSMLAWALGTTLAAVAGVLIASNTDMSAGGSLTIATLVPAFAAAAVGRMRSLPLTYLGAVILGVMIQFSSQFLSWGGRWAQVPNRIPEIMLFVVLLMLPAANVRFARISGVRHRARVAQPRRALISLAALIVVVPFIGELFDATNRSRLTAAMALALIALSLVPLTGWAGQVSFAPLAFAGVGAAAFSHWGGQHGHPWAILFAALAAAPVGAALSLVAGRLQGLYLGLATFAFAYVCRDVILDQPFAFGGQTLDAPRPHWFGISFVDDQHYLTLITVVFALVAFALVVLRNRACGRRLVALRDSEAASATVGVSIFETKVAVFTLSAMIAGFGGAFYAMFENKPSAGSFEALAGLGLVLQMVVGGIMLVSGAIFAGVFQLPIQLVQDKLKWDLLRGLQQIAPGFAALGIIQNPDGAVYAISAGVRGETRREKARARRARASATIEPSVERLGLDEPFTPAALSEIDRRLGVARELAAVEH